VGTPRVVTLAAAAYARDVARGKAPSGFDQIHRALGAAMRVLEPELWPPRPHLGGPLPVLSAEIQLRLALDLAPSARALATPDEHAAFDAAIELARRVAKDRALNRTILDAASKPSKRDSAALRVAKLVVRAASNFEYAPQSARDSVGRNLEAIAVTLVTALRAREPAAVHDFLHRLDDVIVTEALGLVLRDKAIVPTSPLAHVISRPRNDAGKLALALALLEDGRYGLYVKLKARWTWHEGDRSAVFATVPDAHMEDVIEDLDGPPAPVT
jgi:hypothetical protein